MAAGPSGAREDGEPLRGKWDLRQVPTEGANSTSSRSRIGAWEQRIFSVTTGDALMTAMAYDRFLAICQPLTYSALMSHSVQWILVAVSWACALTNALIHTIALTTLSFCGPNEVNHFYCDLPQLFPLSCFNTQLNELLLFAVGFIMAGTPMALIVTSYAHVAAAVLRIHSVEGRKKAFFSCGSHLTVVCLFYGTGIFNYMRLGTQEASDKDKGVGIFNTVINPMLNPLIYSLRNPDVKAALWRVFVGRWLVT